MPEKPWRRSEPGEGKGGRGWVNAIVLAALALAVTAVALVVLVLCEHWENLWRKLPVQWEALRTLLHGEGVRQTEPEPLVTLSPGGP